MATRKVLPLFSITEVAERLDISASTVSFGRECFVLKKRKLQGAIGLVTGKKSTACYLKKERLKEGG